MFEFGVARTRGDGEQSPPSFYLAPTSAAFSIPNPRTGVAREIRDGTSDEVIEFAVTISIEMMARVVASGGMLGTFAEIDSALADQERHAARRERVAKQQRGKKFWRGCGAAILWFFGFFIGVGLFGKSVASMQRRIVRLIQVEPSPSFGREGDQGEGGVPAEA